MDIRRIALFPVLLGVILLPAGCRKNPNAPAEVSGVVRFQNQPLRGGTIAYHTPEGRIYSALIYEDGTYAISDIPEGELKVTVDTEHLAPKKPKPKMEDYGGGKYKVQEYAPPGVNVKKQEDQVKEDKEKYVKIPLRYKDPKSSGLTATLAAGKNKKDFDLSE